MVTAEPCLSGILMKSGKQWQSLRMDSRGQVTGEVDRSWVAAVTQPRVEGPPVLGNPSLSVLFSNPPHSSLFTASSQIQSQKHLRFRWLRGL